MPTTWNLAAAHLLSICQISIPGGVAMRSVASFTIARTEIVRPDGSLAGRLPAFAESRAEVVRLYRGMFSPGRSMPRPWACSARAGSARSPRRSAKRPWWSGSVPRCGPRMCCCRRFASSARSFGAASPSPKRSATGAGTSVARVLRARVRTFRSACRSAPRRPTPSVWRLRSSSGTSRAWRSASSATAPAPRGTSTRP